MSWAARWQGYLLVLLAGSLWATLGLFFRGLRQHNIPPETIALHRAGVSSLVLLIFWAVRRPALLRVRRQDLLYFVLFGVIGVAGFFLLYIKAVNAGSVAMAAVLLYTAPVWIALYAWWRWSQPLSGPRLAALGLALAGCTLVAVGAGDSFGGGPAAVLLGLASGLGYAGYSLFSDAGIKRGYNPWTVVTYSLLAGAVALLPFQPAEGLLLAATTPAAWPLLAGVALVPTLLAPICYTAGIRRIGAPTASIIATVEPLVAALLAWGLLSEMLTFGQIAGGGCILAAIVILARAQTHRAPAADD